MSPENVTRAAEEFVLQRRKSAGFVDIYEPGYRQAFQAGASWSREQHREVLIRLKHLIERGMSLHCFKYVEDNSQFAEAIAVIQKELAP